MVRPARALLPLVGVLLALGSCSKSDGTAAESSTSPSSTPLTSIQRLQVALDADPQIQPDVCYNARKLLSVGWPEEEVVVMLSSDLPYLTKSERAELQSVGMPMKTVLKDLIHRC